MSLTLQPGNSFTVVRQIANHTDTDTNFVQAVIRNAFTDAIIETIQLTDKGSQRFKKDWQVPADSSGQGFYISIVTSVYTTSGYTTKNANYGDEENTYLVQERIRSMLGAGGGGVDSFTLRRIIKEELGKLDIPEGIDYTRIPKPSEINDRTDEIIQAIKDNKVDIPEPKEPTDRTDEILAAIASKDVTGPTDLQPVLDAIQQSVETDGTDFEEIKQSLIATEEKLVQAVTTTIKKAMDETEFTSTFSTRAQPKAAQKQQDQGQPFDVTQLGL